jgi:D-tyrosyl-tRNA(Tyr) deacylase
MRACVQRVSRASVTVEGQTVGAIERGLLVLLGIAADDHDGDAVYLAEKIAPLRIFADEDGKMNRSLLDAGGQMLVVSQFTLLGDCRRGRRPSFTAAAEPQRAETLYDQFVRHIEQLGVIVARGRFRAHMRVELVNDGPVTLLLDSRKMF